MAYKDKDKQREANRRAQAKFKAKGITEGITSEGITEKVLPAAVNLELCRTCQELLPALEKPRKYPGMCLKCVMSKSPELTVAKLMSCVKQLKEAGIDG